MSSIFDIDWVPGEDWTHRIDAVPELNRRVSIRVGEGIPRPAWTVVGEDLTFRGIGSEVGYLCAGHVISAKHLTHWKYMGDDRNRKE